MWHQIREGFEEQRDDYYTAHEAAQKYGHGYRFYLGELKYRGYLERQWHGKRHKQVLRITEQGKKYGQEVLRNDKAEEPFSFRWKEGLIMDLLKILEPRL